MPDRPLCPNCSQPMDLLAIFWGRLECTACQFKKRRPKPKEA